MRSLFCPLLQPPCHTFVHFVKLYDEKTEKQFFSVYYFLQKMLDKVRRMVYNIRAREKRALPQIPDEKPQKSRKKF